MDQEKTIQFIPGQVGCNGHAPLLKALSGALEGRTYPLNEKEYVIGRDPASDIVIDSKDVSRRHAKVEKVGTEYVLCDLGSSNGVFINNLKMPRSVLMNGDLIQIGSCLFQFAWNRSLPSAPAR